jgi:hypothetical protein
MECDAHGLGGGFPLVIEGFQRHAMPHGQVQVGGNVRREILVAREAYLYCRTHALWFRHH